MKQHPEDALTAESGRNEQSNNDVGIISGIDEEYEDDSDDEIDEEEWNERIQILKDTRNLAAVADFFLNPHKPVRSEGTNFARCYFSRPSAPQQTSIEDEKESASIQTEMKQLKKLAADYLHPEKPVEVSANSFGRNYFSRVSADPTIPREEADERVKILADAQVLKEIADDFLHPEKPVVSSDPFATGRNYFIRPSADAYEDVEECQERELLLQDMKKMKQLAVDYLYPEYAVTTSDPFAFGRNFYSRPSAEESTVVDDMEERELILQDMQQLKALAVDFMHPERPVEISDPLNFGRNYFSRPASDDCDVEMDQRALIMQDIKQLKQLAMDYLHPELPAVTSDPYACGRNYFSRPSAEANEEKEEERETIMNDMLQLKQLAVDYLQPERKVIPSDPFACGRNYFSRPAASEQESSEEREERSQILEEMGQMKTLAMDYLHPERPVQSTSWKVRNYFDRASAGPGHANHITSSGHVIFHIHETMHLRQHDQVDDHKMTSCSSADPACVVSFGLDQTM